MMSEANRGVAERREAGVMKRDRWYDVPGLLALAICIPPVIVLSILAVVFP